jgi:cyclopropane fatty-acyl-phospholipid synthase-like methyltransferase
MPLFIHAQPSPPFSEACEQNKHPILALLQQWLTQPATVLEIGSGTGQHAAFFAAQLPHLHWYPSDVAAHLPGIECWRSHANCANLHPAQVLDVNQAIWPMSAVDAVFSANTTHIMSWAEVQRLFQGLAQCLSAEGLFFLYGPFSYQGQHISASNAQFDEMLRQRDPDSGVRDVQDLQTLAESVGLTLLADCEMPVNNRTLIWKRI